MFKSLMKVGFLMGLMLVSLSANQTVELLRYMVDPNNVNITNTNNMHKFIEKGANVNEKFGKKKVPFLSIAPNETMAAFLIDNGAKINAQSMTGWTPLMEYCVDGRINSIKYLLKNGADIDMRKNDGWTAFMVAAYHGHNNILKLLKEKGAELDTQGNKGWTALMAAADQGKVSTVKWLIEQGADINKGTYGQATYYGTRLGSGRTAYDLAADRKYESIMNIIFQQYKKQMPNALIKITENSPICKENKIDMLGLLKNEFDIYTAGDRSKKSYYKYIKTLSSYGCMKATKEVSKKVFRVNDIFQNHGNIVIGIGKPNDRYYISMNNIKKFDLQDAKFIMNEYPKIKKNKIEFNNFKEFVKKHDKKRIFKDRNGVSANKRLTYAYEDAEYSYTNKYTFPPAQSLAIKTLNDMLRGYLKNK